MVSKLHSVRRSLFEEFGEEENDNNALNRKSSKQPTHSSIISIKLSNAFVFCALITVGTIAILTNQLSQNLLKKVGTDMLVKAQISSDWVQENYQDFISPAFCGLFVSVFTMLIVYLDSEVPGLNPPVPFSPRKANEIRYALHQEKTIHLSYLVSIASGIVTTALLYLCL